MKIKNLLGKAILFLAGLFSLQGMAQTPVAGFSVSPNPACTNSTNAVQIIDLSTNSPTAWSYTAMVAGPGPGGTMVFNIQNPIVVFNIPGIYTITLVSTNAAGSSAPVSHTIAVLRSPDININPLIANSCVGGAPINIVVMPNGPGGQSYVYNWSTAATTTSISVSPNATTVYSCIVTATNGCSTVRTSTVVIGQPTVVINGSPVNICPGSNSTLTAVISGQGPSTYSWSTGSTNNNITTAIGGTYSVIATNGLGCTGMQTYNLGTSTTLSLTAIANPSSICAGNIGNLHVSGASSYTWNNGATTINTMVNPTVTTTYTVIGQTGACLGVTTVVMNVSQTPTVTVQSSTNSICSGNSVLITANGATTYTWIPGGTVSSTLSVSPTANTTYTIRGQNPGCPARGATVTISVLQNPSINISTTASIICVGEEVALAASGASTYQWSTGSTSPVILASPGVTTTYTVVGTGLNNCSANASIVQNVSDCTGIVENNKEKFNVFPNPNNGNFVIQSADKIIASIISQTGQLVRQLDLVAGNNYYITTDLPDGIYFMIGQNAGSTFKQKLIISR